MEKKRFYKIIRALKHNGEIHEFPFTLPYTLDEAYALAVDSTDFSVWDLIALAPVEPMCSIAVYIVTFEDKKDTLLCPYRVIAKNGIKAIDLAIKEFENDYHHRDIDFVGLERCKYI
nr:MAG TPA: hypothetical protein [Microviridae sp.]